MNKILSDPCLRANCNFGEICIQNADRQSYTCANERSLAVTMQQNPNRDSFDVDDLLASFPKEFHDEYLNFDDPCLSSPCSFGTVCRAGANLREYMCVDERSFQPQASQGLDRQQMMGSVNDFFTKFAPSKVSGDSSFTQLRGTSKKSDPCASSPCAAELECVASKKVRNSYECVEKQQAKEDQSTEAGQVAAVGEKKSGPEQKGTKQKESYLK